MMQNKQQVEEQIQKLRQKYVSSLPDKLSALHATWNLLLNKNWNMDDLTELHRNAHSMVGTSSTFGLERIGLAARSVEMELKSLLSEVSQPDRTITDRIKQKLNNLEYCCREHISSKPAQIDNSAQPSDAESGIVEEKPPESDKNQITQVLIIEDSAGISHYIKGHLEQFSYAVTVCLIAEVFDWIKRRSSASNKQPDVVIFNVERPTEQHNEIIQDIYMLGEEMVPCIYICNYSSLENRLQAVRSGSIAYLSKPTEEGALIDVLDKISISSNVEPYRVLIVDDSEDLAETYSVILQQAGMKTKTISNPLEALNTLIGFSPELILMDLYMPQCSGLELATVIRQESSYTSIPIVFLSSESNLDEQLNAMRLGGDDFLTKPIKPDHLISSVTIRTTRYRELRSFMVKDSLTGLLNHSKTDEQLEIEIARCKRESTLLSYAMIDIDHFKSINDKYGHATGDNVIKSLARLLKQSTRKTDVIGRYGGEEFVVILPNSGEHNALIVIEKIRKQFESLVFQSSKHRFSVTLSAGIASFPQFPTCHSLQEAADNVLYDSKNMGRNQTSIAKP